MIPDVRVSWEMLVILAGNALGGLYFCMFLE